jgi:hypothetical protein
MGGAAGWLLTSLKLYQKGNQDRRIPPITSSTEKDAYTTQYVSLQ